MRRLTASGAATMTLAALTTFGMVACSQGESADAPEGSRMDAGYPAMETLRTVPVGTSLIFRVQETVSTESHAAGDAFMATLERDILDYQGEVLIRAGTRSRWMVAESSSSGGSDGEAVLAIRLGAVELDGQWTSLDATVTGTDIRTGARDTNTETAAKVAVGAAAGAILGQIIGRNTGSTLKGAGAGAVVGTVVALSTRGSKATLPEGSTITVRLEEPVSVR
jgi:hypothetical protein